MKTLYNHSSAGRLGFFFPLCWQATMPISRFSIDSHSVTLKVFPFSATLLISEIEYISKSPLGWLEFKHRSPTVVSYFSMNSTSSEKEKIIQILKSLNVKFQ